MSNELVCPVCGKDGNFTNTWGIGRYVVAQKVFAQWMCPEKHIWYTIDRFDYATERYNTKYCPTSELEGVMRIPPWGESVDLVQGIVCQGYHTIDVPTNSGCPMEYPSADSVEDALAVGWAWSNHRLFSRDGKCVLICPRCKYRLIRTRGSGSIRPRRTGTWGPASLSDWHRVQGGKSDT